MEDGIRPYEEGEGESVRWNLVFPCVSVCKVEG